MSYFVRKVQRRSPLINRGECARAAGGLEPPHRRDLMPAAARRHTRPLAARSHAAAVCRTPPALAGYFARVAAIDLIVRRFLAVAKRTGDGRCQVVSLGAGMDSTFFRLYADGAAPTTYFEVDFPEVTARKAAIIRRQPLLQKCVAGRPVAKDECVSLDAVPPPSGGGFSGGSPHRHGSSHHAAKDGSSAASSSPATTGGGPAAAAAATTDNPFGIAYVNTASGGCDIRGVSAAAAATSSSSSSSAPLPGGGGGPYRLVTADLRDVAAVQASLVTGAGLDPALPTLFLSECVLVYLEPEESCAIIGECVTTGGRRGSRPAHQHRVGARRCHRPRPLCLT
jgi:hypothetical protein